MEELIRVLEKTVSNLQSDQNEAIRYINEYIKRDITGFLKALSEVLYNQQNLPIVRTAAGLQLKNQLTSRDETVRLKLRERWRALPEDIRQYIKDRVFGTLGNEMFSPSSASQCVAYIAIAELNEKGWPNFIELLVRNIKNTPNNDKLRLATLEAIACICQDITLNEPQNNKKREITNGLNASMATIYSYIGDCMSSQNYDLMTTALDCLSGILSWAQANASLLGFLCQLLRNYEMLPSSVPHEFCDKKSAIMSTACECLNVFLERKHSKPDSIDIRTSLYEDEVNLHSIISTLDKLNRLSLQHQQQQQVQQNINDVIKKLCQVLSNILRYVHVGPPEKPQNLQEMFTIMNVIIGHSSNSISVEAVRFWSRMFAISPKKPNPSLDDDLVFSLLLTCANKLIRVNYNSSNDAWEFECQEDFDAFQVKYRVELQELCRHLTLQNDRICFNLVYNSIANSIQQRNMNLNGWDALATLAGSICGKLKDPSLYLVQGVDLTKGLLLLMDEGLNRAPTIVSNSSGSDAGLIPNLISSQLSCVSALFVFLPYWHRTDKGLTENILKKIIVFTFHRPDKSISSSRQLMGDNTNLLNNEAFLKGFRSLSRHASACFVKVCVNHSRHLVDLFIQLKNHIDSLFESITDNPYSLEKCQLYEGLLSISNDQSDESSKKKFVLELLESVKWFQDYELNCDQFIEFLGLNRLEVEQEGITLQNMISQPMSPSQVNRIKLAYVISFIGSIVRRLNSRNTLLPEILNFVRPILNILFTMNALWLPGMQSKCLEEYKPFLFAPFNSAYKQQILDATTNQKPANVGEHSISGTYDSSSFGDMIARPSRGNRQHLEIFSWNFYEALLNTMGAIINKTSPELFSIINTGQFQNALTGAEYLPQLKMHKLIKNFITPLIINCSRDQHLIVTQSLPLLDKLLPFLFDMLEDQWKKYHEDDAQPVNGKLDQNQALLDEINDHLLRNLSRDFIDLMNIVLVEAVTPTSTDVNSNNNPAISLAQQGDKGPNAHGQNSSNRYPVETHKIGNLGLNMLSAGPDFIMKVMATTLTWSDSTLNAKAIFINQQLIRHILASRLDVTSAWLGSMFMSVIISLRMFGEHEQNCSGLLTLFLHLYDNLKQTTPNFHDHLEKMTGVPKSAFQKYDQDSVKCNEKNKRAGLRRLLDNLVQKK